MNLADFIVDTGDAAVLLPIAALVFAALWLAGTRRGSGLILLHGQRVEAERPIKGLATLIDEAIGPSVSR